MFRRVFAVVGGLRARGMAQLALGWWLCIAAPWAYAAAVVSVVPSHSPVQAGDAFTLTVTYDSPMDTSVNPAVSFPTPGEDPGSFLLPTGALWLNATTFQRSYTAEFVLVEAPPVDVAVDGALDTLGAAQDPALVLNVFEIVPWYFIPPPHVIDMKGSVSAMSVWPAGGAHVINDADVGATVEFIIRFDIPTDYAGCGTDLHNLDCLNLVFTNSGGTPLTLANPTSQWLTRNRYRVTWTIADGDEQLDSINVLIPGGIGRKDDTNNKNAPFELVGVFSIDTKNPSVSAVVPSVPVLRSASAAAPARSGAVSLRAGEIFSLTVAYSEPMDPSSTPVFSFPNHPAVAAILTPTGGSWVDSTHYVQSFVAGAGVAVFPAVDVQVTGARDVNGNLQNLALLGAVFAVQLGAAAAALAVPALSPWGVLLLCSTLVAVAGASRRRRA